MLQTVTDTADTAETADTAGKLADSITQDEGVNGHCLDLIHYATILPWNIF